jgi:hypothetical protein
VHIADVTVPVVESLVEEEVVLVLAGATDTAVITGGVHLKGWHMAQVPPFVSCPASLTAGTDRQQPDDVISAAAPMSSEVAGAVGWSVHHFVKLCPRAPATFHSVSEGCLRRLMMHPSFAGNGVVWHAAATAA